MMKKQTRLLMLIGAIGMSFPLFTRSFINIPELISDLIKGTGVGIIFAAFFLELKRKETCKVNKGNQV
ncbi:MAG TPA: hypothetical protein VGO09_09630 [Flavisolibacter sp.]|jgi:hypothetical protein|nr:hypothetical protein [Flavisolibacter sp.]